LSETWKPALWQP